MKDRGRNAGGRQQGLRPARTSILIVCEGSETEPMYLKHIQDEKSQTLDIKIDRGCNAANMLGRVERLLRIRGYDHTWCVLDHDERSGIELILEQIRQQHRVAFSNPCVEIWYYWHFDAQGLCTKAKIQRLLKQKIRGYRKSMDVYDQLSPMRDTAGSRAQEWRQRNEEFGSSEFANPSTGMDQLVQFLEDLAAGS